MIDASSSNFPYQLYHTPRDKSLKKDGKTVFIVTHDLEFAAECADRCGLLFRGNIVSVDNTNKFFTGNKFYTTVANKVSTGILSDVITLEELTDAYLKSVERS
jgi:energy-coupling factor transport system ATP-binding protein